MEDVELHKIFPSPVWQTRLENMDHNNNEMLEYVLDLNKRVEGEQRSNVLGWHSPDQLQKVPAFEPLCNSIYRLVKENILDDIGADHASSECSIDKMWGIVNGKYAHNTLHRHPGFILSGVYYLRTAGEDSGMLKFHDPRADIRMLRPDFAEANEFYKYVVPLKPEVGVLVVFPSWLPHAVDPNQSDVTRVSISFDMSF